MIRSTRILLILLTIFVCSIALPKLYWLAFEEPIRKPFVIYSCVDNDFMIFDAATQLRYDTRGNSYTREEMEEKLPLMYMRQLLISEKMPDSIRGVEMDMKLISKARSTFRLNAKDINSPQPKVFPLFESESGRASLELPEEFFRITWRMEFLNALTNSINEEQSQRFSAALYQKGFQFPAKSISGIPTVRKSCDEGYFITDANDQLFHVKMVHNNPFVYHVELPSNIEKLTWISCIDNKDKLYFGYAIANDQSVYAISQLDYSFKKIPTEGYNSKTCNLKIYSDYFHYNVIVENDHGVRVQACDKEFQVVDTYNKQWQTKYEQKGGAIAASIFPFQMSLTSPHSKYIGLYPINFVGFYWIIVNIIICIIYVLISRRKTHKIDIFDLIIVCISGIYGFIAVFAFRNEHTTNN